MVRCDLFKHAYSMAYVTLLSLIPSLAAILGLISLFKPLLGENSAFILNIRSLILEHLATGTGEQAISLLENLLNNLDIAKIGITGFGGMLLSLILLLKQVETALNRIFYVNTARHVITRFIYFWTFLTLGSLLISLGFGFFSGINLEFITGINSNIGKLPPYLSSLFTFFGLFIFFTLMFKVVPNCYISINHAAIGAATAAILLVIAIRFYGYFTHTFTQYKLIYGALAALPVFLLWIYILWVITLFGAVVSWRASKGMEFNSNLEDKNNEMSSELKLRNHQIQSSVPLIALLAIHSHFEKGKGGIFGHELALQLDLPSNWVADGIQFLVTTGYVVENQSSPDIQGFWEKRFFPTAPPSSINIGNLKKHFNEQFSNWLANWCHDSELNISHCLKELTQDKYDDFQISEFLCKNES